MSFSGVLNHPRALGIACAVGAVLLGLAYLALAQAPMRYLVINAGALAMGLAALAFVSRVPPPAGRWWGALTLIMAVALLLTALFGDQVDGAARWVRLGGLFIQPSLVLLPLTIVGFARSRNPLALAGMIGAAAALAIQPDRAMAGMLVAGLAVLALMRPDRLVIAALTGSVVGFAVTLLRADTLPAVAYVDQILFSSFGVHALAGWAVLGGCALLLVPPIVGGLFDAGHRETYAVFGAVWLAAVLAAALGNYPTPVVGYGGSAVVGYLLSLALLPSMARPYRHAAAALRDDDRDGDQPLRVGIASAA